MVTASAWPGPLAQEFFRNAVLAGTLTAVAAGLTGYFVVLRNQVFAADALSHVAFTGGLGALAYGAGLRFGVFGGTVAAAVGLGLLGGRAARADDTVIGIVFAWVLGVGAYFLSVFVGGRSTSNGAAAVRVLFGSVFGLRAADVRLTLWLALLTVGGLVAIARPLLFSTVDPDVARAQGVPVRTLEVVHLVLVGLAVAQAVQVVGSLLLLALVATPTATAARLTTRPWRALVLAPALGTVGLWGGLGLSYARADLPPSFAIVSLLFAFYLLAVAVGRRGPGTAARG